MSQSLKAICISMLATVALLAAFFAARSMGQHTIADVLLWQNTWLQSLIPPLNIGSIEHPVYEGSPLNILAFFASVPLGFVVYSFVAYIWIRIRHRRT